MFYSYKIEQAIRAAAVLHHGQTRKGRASLPYVTHLYAVAMIVADYTDDEDTIVAALLHDTLEDTGYLPEDLLADFGENVQQIVLSVSEHVGGPSVKKDTWEERKERYTAKLNTAHNNALIVSAADKIHNMRATIEEYYGDHERFLKDFTQPPRDQIVVYQTISNILNRRLKNDILNEFNHIFSEFKKFIADVEKKK